MTYGLRGIAYFFVTISGPGADLHSGGFGGAVFEPMTDLIALMSKLVTSDAQILILGIYNGVKPASDEEVYGLGYAARKKHLLTLGECEQRDVQQPGFFYRRIGGGGWWQDCPLRRQGDGAHGSHAEPVTLFARNCWGLFRNGGKNSHTSPCNR